MLHVPNFGLYLLCAELNSHLHLVYGGKVEGGIGGRNNLTIARMADWMRKLDVEWLQVHGELGAAEMAGEVMPGWTKPHIFCSRKGYLTFHHVSAHWFKGDTSAPRDNLSPTRL